jgi:hypothetical protein
LAGELLFSNKQVKQQPKTDNVGGHRHTARKERPADVTKLYRDIMSVIDNNGHVTLPRVPFFANSLTSRQVRTFGVWLAILAVVALYKISRRAA